MTFFSGESKCPNGSIPLPAEDRSKNGQKSKKRKKHGALDQNYVNGDGDAFQKEIFSNIVADMGSMVNFLPAKFEELVLSNVKLASSFMFFPCGYMHAYGSVILLSFHLF